MSMLGSQIKELREAARNMQGKLGRCLYRRKDVDEIQQVSGMLFEAADTIESLRDRLQADVLWSETCNPVETATLENATAHVMECDMCGGTYEHVNGDYEHCPRCGKRVERGNEVDTVDDHAKVMTCGIVDGRDCYSDEDYMLMLSCGHSVSWPAPNFCPSCGARIRKAVER